MGYRTAFLSIIFGVLAFLAVSYYEIRIHYGVQIAFGATLSLYLAIPLVVHFSPYIQRHLVFLPAVRFPIGVDFNKPEELGLKGGRNFYLDPEEGFRIGVWHLLPKSLVAASEDKGKSEEHWNTQLKNSGKPVVIYCHGNTGSRAGEHRRELYALMQDLDYHVVSFDYRGYADSTECLQSETGVVTDARAVYDWVVRTTEESKKVPIFVWGHSLGTGVSCHFVSDLCTSNARTLPAGLFLESPFSSLGEEIRYHMLTWIFTPLPFFDFLFISPLKHNDIEFQSDLHIKNITVPIVIMHAIDDPVIPFFLAKRLFRTGVRTRPKYAKPIHFKDFGEGYAHKFICRAPELPELMTDFVNSCTNDRWPCRALQDSTNVVLRTFAADLAVED